MALSRWGGWPLRDFLEMPLDEIADWLELAGDQAEREQREAESR